MSGAINSAVCQACRKNVAGIPSRAEPGEVGSAARTLVLQVRGCERNPQLGQIRLMLQDRQPATIASQAVFATYHGNYTVARQQPPRAGEPHFNQTKLCAFPCLLPLGSLCTGTCEMLPTQIHWGANAAKSVE